MTKGMIFFPWLFVAFGFGWLIGRQFLNRWWRAELQKIETSAKEYIKKSEEAHAKTMKLVDECRAAVFRDSVGK